MKLNVERVKEILMCLLCGLRFEGAKISCTRSNLKQANAIYFNFMKSCVGWKKEKFTFEMEKREIAVKALSVKSDYFCRKHNELSEGFELFIEYQMQWRAGNEA